MKTILLSKVSLALTIFIIFPGCTTIRKVDLVTEGVVSAKRLSTKHADISTIHVYGGKTETEISAGVYFRGASRRFSHGHVDFTIYRPDESIFMKAVSGSRYRHARRGTQGATIFRARIRSFIPDGSTIQAVYHKGSIKRECKIEIRKEE